MRPDLKFISRIEYLLAIVLFIIFCAVFIPAPDHFIRIHDNFDGNFSTRHVLIKSGKFFETNPKALVPGIMNGLPRGVFPKFTEIVSLCMIAFGSLTGYAVNFILVRIVAFLGIVLFARDHLKLNPEQKGLVALTALVFACLPFSTMHGITVAGIPLILWAFNNMRKGCHVLLSILVFIIFPLWSNFVLVGVHLIMILGIFSIYYSIRDKRIHWKLFSSVAIIAITYILSEYMLFYMHWFNSDYTSSRSDFEKTLGLNFNGIVGNSFNLFFKGEFSAACYAGYLYIPMFIYLLVRYFTKRDSNTAMGFFFLVCSLIFVILISVLDWQSFAFFYEKFPIAKEFNLKRFINLLPGFFFLAVLSSFLSLNNRQSWPRLSAPLLLILAYVFAWRGNISFNDSAFDTTGLRIVTDQRITFRQFFDPDLYKTVKLEIGKDTLNNVIHFGISPAPSKYAGLNVLDDYQGDYPKEYKDQFRLIIKGELEKSDGYRNYFDNWGGRCYLMSASLFSGKPESKYGELFEPDLSINTDQIKKMNGKYILSSVIIGNAKELDLELKKVIVSHIDKKKIFIYKIK